MTIFMPDVIDIKIDKKGKVKLIKSRSKLEDEFLMTMIAAGLPMPVREYKFTNSQDKGWSIDFAWPKKKVSLEVHGEKHHGRYHQVQKDAEKSNELISMGWKCYIITGNMIKKNPHRVLEILKQELMD